MESPDGDANFPGAVTAVVTMKVTDDNAIDISYEAVTDRKTVINMTNHTYFNLSGDPTRRVDDQIMQINADNYTPVDFTFMTTGEILPVEGTPMDFRQPVAIGQDIKNFEFQQVKFGNGFDQIAIHFSDKKHAAPVNAPPLLIAGQNTASLRNQKNAVPACGVRASGRLNLIDKVQADQVAGVVVVKLTHIFELHNAPPCGSCLL
jgi:hypothetical protein